MSKMNKMNLFCIKCKNITDDRTSTEIKHDADTVNMFYCICIDCGYKKLKDIDREHFNYYSK